MNLSELFLNRYLYKDNNQSAGTKDSVFNSIDNSDTEPASIPSGGAAQDINTGNVQIDGAIIEDGTIPSTTLDVSNWGWGQSCAFSSDDNDTVSWGAGTFTSADGTAYSIDAGNTGDMAAKTYIYLSLLDSETVYQKSTTSSDSVGLGKVLIAVAENAADSATYNLQEASQIVADNILANTIDASKITTGQLVVGDAWVGLGSAEDAAGVTTIVGDTITTGYITALGIVVGTEVGIGTAFATVDAGDLAYLSLVEKAKLGTTIIEGGYLKTGFVDADRIDTGTLVVGRSEAKCTDATANNTQTALTAGANIDNAKANGTTLISGGYLATEIINCSTLTVGSIPVGQTDAKCTDALADQTSANTAADISGQGDLATLSLVETAQLGTTVIVGGYIKTSLLTADNIIAGTLTGITITGNTIRTSASGLRVEMTSTDTNKISFYNSAALYGELEVSYTSPKGFISLLTQDGNGLTLDTDIAVSGYNASALKSNGGTFDTYGNATNRMIMMDGSAGSGTSMFGIQYTSGTFRLITDLRLQSDWLPYATATQDLGSVSYKWQDLHLNNDFIYRTKPQPVVYSNYVSGTTLSKGNSGFSVTNSSTGVYVVTHSFGLTNYTVQVTPYAASGGGAPSAKISSIATNSFTVITYDDTGTAAAFDFQFMLLLNT